MLVDSIELGSRPRLRRLCDLRALRTISDHPTPLRRVLSPAPRDRTYRNPSNERQPINSVIARIVGGVTVDLRFCPCVGGKSVLFLFAGQERRAWCTSQRLLPAGSPRLPAWFSKTHRQSPRLVPSYREPGHAVEVENPVAPFRYAIQRGLDKARNAKGTI